VAASPKYALSGKKPAKTFPVGKSSAVDAKEAKLRVFVVVVNVVGFFVGIVSSQEQVFFPAASSSEESDVSALL